MLINPVENAFKIVGRKPWKGRECGIPFFGVKPDIVKRKTFRFRVVPEQVLDKKGCFITRVK